MDEGSGFLIIVMIMVMFAFALSSGDGREHRQPEYDCPPVCKEDDGFRRSQQLP